ncbi:MAG: fructosamine kinase family protein [Gammaproteobacteria bacterium]
MSAIRAAIEQLVHEASAGSVCTWQALGRGVGGSTWHVSCGDSVWFVKTAQDARDLFVAEADDLKALAECKAIRVPRVLAAGEQDGEAFLIMEWLTLGRKTGAAVARLGEQLARQHQCFGQHFGWRQNNFIGATPQFNTPAEDWAKFFREHRLGFQLRLVAENGYRGILQEQGARLMETLPEFFIGYSPQPSLLHGDLWGGNWGVLDTGEPVIFDPAVYYGDREADIAMTELFGGFGQEFYFAYNAVCPLDAGYRVRRDLYNLYHLLNHLNVFGESYMPQAEQLMRQLVSNIG